MCHNDCTYFAKIFIQVGDAEMVKGLKETDLPEPWFGNKSKAPPASKRPKVTSELMPEQEALEAEATGTCMKKGKGRGKGKKRKTLLQGGKIM